jgi:hypothetical protein
LIPVHTNGGLLHPKPTGRDDDDDDDDILK